MGGTFQKCTIQFEEEIDGKENAEKLAEGHADGGDGSGLDHQKKRPAVEKSPERPQRFAQVNVLAAGAGHHGGQFAVAEGADDGQKSGHQPGPDQQRGRINLAGYFRRDNKDAGADHGTHDQHGGAGQSQTLYQFLILTAVEVPVGGACRRRWLGFGAHSPPRDTCGAGVLAGAQHPRSKASRLYLNMRKNSSADLRGSRIKSDITATASAPASMTERQLSRVIPPIATRGLRVNALA